MGMAWKLDVEGCVLSKKHRCWSYVHQLNLYALHVYFGYLREFTTSCDYLG